MAIEKFARTYTLEIPERTMQPTADGHGTSLQPTGKVDRFLIEVAIDLGFVVFNMGCRAIKSKGGRCQDGPIMVKKVRKL